ncbi:transporter [Methylolobus aquaticus]|uniref:TOBE domain-containing protein n=1 Tax=Methylotetracoccus oryzae TaxID=1919059 RepID=UPI00101FD353|nr:TOBE domain-containing protein [Methylotetracoccus oryzae]RYU58978.1 transporter [Methylolobus aquaticus]
MSIVALTSPNQFRGRIRAINLGPVVSEVEVQVEGGIVTSVITSSSLESLGLKVGDQVLALVKSSEVAVARLYDRTRGAGPYLD